ncbi:hypothetical protein [Paraburkholderia antibiotica]|uniref:DUF4148 domain-containing protein n=1 Tax=Paraburkholderia antibiotica TaxID=2728839 RepID=A0A7X9ZYL6_9BURK|nr:hypothetical protein [Paraburkholderia antibiotica]NML32931.1 hypothetical protein [Paraburkholderia antibiotica]
MKVRVLTIAACAVLLLAPRTASAAEVGSQPDAGTSGRAMMQMNANESAQATTDVSFGQSWQPREQAVQNASYGGVAAGQSEAGGKRGQSCAVGTQCKVYFGQ